MRLLLLTLLVVSSGAPLLGQLLDFITDAVDAVGDAVGDVADAVGDAVGDVTDAVGDAVGDVTDAIGDVADAVTEVITDNVLITQPLWPDDYADNLRDGDTFDYIVVGAGAAGSATASRLALAGWDVLLLEAGGNPNILTRIPGAATSLQNSDMDWAYPTLPNNQSCLSSLEEQCTFARGFCLGGSTSINLMIYIRGNRRDFDDWNIPTWTYDDVEPYFLKYEGLQDLDKLPSSSIPYHNTTGILKVEFFGDTGNSWHERLLEGFESVGFPFNPDANGVSQVGVTETVGYVYDGERMSTARAYLTNEEIKSKLKVAKNAQCTGVILNQDNEAIGVNVTIKGLIIDRKVQLYVREEVILSAGAIGTPQILMLSGIGPADHLEEMGIEVRSDLPVGDNLSDHVMALVIMKIDRGYPAAVATIRSFGMLAPDAVTWLATRDGPLRTINTVDIITLFNSSCYDFNSGTYDGTGDYCDLPSTEFSNAYVDTGLLPPIKLIAQEILRLNDEVVDQIVDANKENALINFSPIVLRPYSRGNIRLVSTDGLCKLFS